MLFKSVDDMSNKGSVRNGHTGETKDVWQVSASGAVDWFLWQTVFVISGNTHEIKSVA